MGLSKGSGDNTTFIQLKGKKQGSKTDPHFALINKTDKGWKAVDKFPEFRGYLVGMEIKEFDYEGKTIENLVTKWKDQHENFQIEQLFSSGITRNMLNTFAGFPGVLDLPISMKLYTNKSGYGSIYIEIDGTRVDWHTSPKDFPEVEAHKDKKGNVVHRDTTDLDDFFRNLMNTEVIPKITDVKIEQTSIMEDSEEEAEDFGMATPEDENEEEFDDLPF